MMNRQETNSDFVEDTQAKKVINMDIFDWQEFRDNDQSTQRTRDTVITKAFEQYMEGNDWFNDLSSIEMQSYFSTFRAAWIIHEMYVL